MGKQYVSLLFVYKDEDEGGVGVKVIAFENKEKMRDEKERLAQLNDKLQPNGFFKPVGLIEFYSTLCKNDKESIDKKIQDAIVKIKEYKTDIYRNTPEITKVEVEYVAN